jgi:type I restriction enzyme, S subunit
MGQQMPSEGAPEGWKPVRLGQHTYKPDYGYTISATTEPVGPRLLRITDIQDDGVNWETVPYCNCDDPAKRRYGLRPGDIVVARIGASTGKAYLITECPEAVFASYLIRTRPKADLVPEFLYYFLHSDEYWSQIQRSKGGRLKGGVSIPVLEGLVLPLPPLLEQRAIARVLRAIQAARETRQREVALERERKAALMEHLFTHGTRGEPTKQTPIGEMPESWEARELGSICDVRYGLGQPPELDENGVPMIRATDIKAGTILSENVVRVKRQAIPKGRSPFLQAGDILVVRSGAYTGDVAAYDGRWESAVVGYDLVATPKCGGVDSVYVASFLLSGRGARYFRSQRDRSAQPHLNAIQLRKAMLPLPPSFQQNEIAEVSSACDAKIAALEREGRLLDELFCALLEELMTGRVSVAGWLDNGESPPT